MAKLTLTKTSAKTIKDLFIAGGNKRVMKLEGGAFMDLHMELIYNVEEVGTVWSFAHYGKQNGDAMRDPDVELINLNNGGWMPLTFRNDYMGTFNEAAWVADGKITGKPAEIRDIASFVNTWLKNLKETHLN